MFVYFILQSADVFFNFITRFFLKIFNSIFELVEVDLAREGKRLGMVIKVLDSICHCGYPTLDLKVCATWYLLYSKLAHDYYLTPSISRFIFSVIGGQTPIYKTVPKHGAKNEYDKKVY